MAEYQIGDRVHVCYVHSDECHPPEVIEFDGTVISLPFGPEDFYGVADSNGLSAWIFANEIRGKVPA